MKYLLIISVLMLASCDDTAESVPTPAKAMGTDSARFSVAYHGTFNAAFKDRANVRSIYVITDTKTKIEYLAVEGCGTAQLVTVQHGKTSSAEEQ